MSAKVNQGRDPCRQSIMMRAMGGPQFFYQYIGGMNSSTQHT